MSELVTRPLYPEAKINGPYGALEEHLAALNDPNSLPRYGELPSDINSTLTERYANWFSDTVAQLPIYEGKELGAYIHLRRSSGILIYPSRPEVGDEHVVPPFARKITSALPVAFVHSHPTNLCFSQPPGDVACAINGYEDRGGHIQVPVWVLSTPDDNFLLLRTQETTNRTMLEIGQMGYEAVDTSGSAFLEFRRYGTEIGRSMSRESFFKLLEKAEELDLLPRARGFSAFYRSYFGTFALARKYKLGFYHSNKDGNYHRITEDFLTELVRRRYEQALRTAQKVL